MRFLLKIPAYTYGQHCVLFESRVRESTHMRFFKVVVFFMLISTKMCYVFSGPQ
nr:unnamed protein product [Callosobruchus analis]